MGEESGVVSSSHDVCVRVAAIAVECSHGDDAAELFTAVRHRVRDVLYVAVDDRDDGKGHHVSGTGDESAVLRKRLELAHNMYRLCATLCPSLSVRLLFMDSVGSGSGTEAENGHSASASLLARPPEVVFVSERLFTKSRDTTSSSSSLTTPPTCRVLTWLKARTCSVYRPATVQQAAAISAADRRHLKPEVSDDRVRLTHTDAMLCCYDNVVMGGTFDRLHCGHCLLLTSAALITRTELTIGVSEAELLSNKKLHELIEPAHYRSQQIRAFLADVAPALRLDVVPITDAAGPAGIKPELQCILVSQETSAGILPINQQRKDKGLSQLSTIAVSLVSANCGVDMLSSTHSRRAELGRLLPALLPGRTNAPWMTRLQKSVQQNQLNQPVEEIPGFMGDTSINVKLPPPEQLQRTTYVVGLTGGIASGKTWLSSKLKEMGAAILSCDLLAHQAYTPGTDCYNRVLKTFGEDIVNDDGTINRKRLSDIVFRSNDQLQALNRIVWPAVARLINQTMVHHATEGTRLVVVENVLLRESGMDRVVDEVWTVMVSQEEAVRRLQSNGLSTAEAQARIASQATNQQRLDYTSLVMSTMYDREQTVQEQLVPAWEGLLMRMKCFKLATIGRAFEERWLKVCKSCGVSNTAAKEFLTEHLLPFHDTVDKCWCGQDSVIRKLNQCDYLLPYLKQPSLMQLAVFFSRGGLVVPLLSETRTQQALSLFNAFVRAVKLTDKKSCVVNGFLSAGRTQSLVEAGTEYEYFSDLEVTEDFRLLLLESELGVKTMADARRGVYELLESSPRVMRTSEMETLLGHRIQAKVRRRKV